MNSIISAKNISKAFGDNAVITDFSHDFEKGGITCITGPSGCGKTTLLRMLSGIIKPDGGEIKRDHMAMSFVFQEDRLCESFTALSNIRLVTGKNVPEEIIREHLLEVLLGDFADAKVRDFSGGMKRRVAIVRALCHPARLLFMDEPFKGLDAKMKIKVMDYVKNHTKDKTVIFVTHDDFEAKYMGAGVINLEKL